MVALSGYLSPTLLLHNSEYVRMSVEAYFSDHVYNSTLAALAQDEEYFELEPEADGSAPPTTDAPSTKSLLDHTPASPPEKKRTAEGRKPPKGKVQSASKNRMRVFLANSLPTPESFARAVGFSNFRELTKAAKAEEYPVESRHYLISGCSLLMDIYTKAGLLDALDSRFVKFILAANFEMREAPERTNQLPDNTINICWTHNGASYNQALVSAPMPPHPSQLVDLVTPLPQQAANQLPYYVQDGQQQELDPDIIELERLEAALPKEMQVQRRQPPIPGQEELEALY